MNANVCLRLPLYALIALLISVASLARSSTSQEQGCDECPPLTPEPLTNVATTATGTFTTSSGFPPLVEDEGTIEHTHFNLTGSQWVTQEPDSESESGVVDSYYRQLLQTVEQSGPGVDGAYLEARNTAEGFAQSKGLTFEETQTGDEYRVYGTAQGTDYDSVGTINGDTFTRTDTVVDVDVTTTETLTITAPEHKRIYIWTWDEIAANGFESHKNYTITVDRRHRVAYRMHFIGEAGRQYTVSWGELEHDSAEHLPFASNSNFLPGYNPAVNPVYSFGDPVYQNPNNGTLTPVAGEVTANIVGGAGPSGQRVMAVLADGSVSDPGFNAELAVSTRTATGTTKQNKRSYTVTATGRVQHTPWYEPSGAKKSLAVVEHSSVCTWCGVAREKVSIEELEIDLGPSTMGESSGHIRINFPDFAAFGRAITPNQTEEVASGIDEFCILWNQPPELQGVIAPAGHFAKGVLLPDGQQLRTLSTVANIAKDANGQLTVTVYRADDMDSSASVWTPKVGTTHVTQWTLTPSSTGSEQSVTVTKSVPNGSGGSVNQTTTYTYNAANQTYTLEQPLARTDVAVSLDDDEEVERIERRDPQGTLSSVVENRYQELTGAGRMLVKSIEDPDGAALTTLRNYYSDGQLRTIVTPAGGWTRYEYDTQGRLLREITGKDNTQLADPDGALTTQIEANSVITEYSYVPASAEDTSTDTWTPRMIVVKLGTTEISRSYTILTPQYTKQIRCTKPNPAGGAYDSSNLTDTIWLCTEGAAWTIGKVRKIDYADGRREVHFYDFPSPHTAIETILMGEPDPENIVNVIKGTRTILVNRSTGRSLSSIVEDIETGVTLSETEYSDFDEDHRPQQADYHDGTSATISYACCGVDTVTRSDGSSVTYEYDDLKRVEHEHHQTADGRKLSLTYTYDASGRVRGVSRKWNDGTEVAVNASKYDLAGRILGSTNLVLNLTEKYDYSVNPTTGQETITTTYPNESTRIEIYNRDGSLAKVTGTAVAPARFAWGVENLSGTDYVFGQRFDVNQDNTEPGRWVKSYFDALLRPVRITSSANDPVQFFYDSQGRPKRVLNADGDSFLRSYDSLGRPEFSVIDLHGDGLFHLDGLNRVSKTTSSVVEDDAVAGEDVYLVQSYVWPDDNEDDSRLAAEVRVSVDGRRVWRSIYNDGSRVTTTSVVTFNSTTKDYTHTLTTPNGTVTEEVFRYGLKRSSVIREADGTVLQSETYGYDDRNRLEKIIDARNGETTIVYNSKDQVESITTPAPASGQARQTTTYIYDDYGQLEQTVLPDQSIITQEYHPNGLLWKRYGSQTYPVHYGYDDAQRLVGMTNWMNASQKEVTTWNYHPVSGRLTSMRYPATSSGNPGTAGEDYLYTTAGRLWKMTKVGGPTTTYFYTGAGEVKTVSFSDGTPGIQRIYDRLGHLRTITHADQVILRDYNHAGQLLTESHTEGPLAGFSVSRTYNAHLQPDTMTALDGAVTLTAMDYDYVPPSGNGLHARLRSVTGGPGESIKFGYAPNSPLLTTVDYRSGGSSWINRSMTYDFLNRLTQVSTQNGDSHSYLFDALNRRTRDTLDDGSRWEYAYDELGQLTGANFFEPGGAQHLNKQFAYTSDQIGNLLTAQSPSIGGGEQLTFVYNKQNQLETVPHSPTTPFIGKIHPQANINVLSSTPFTATKARQGEDYRIQLDTGTSASDRYLTFTHYGVRNQGSQPDVLTTQDVTQFIPKGTSETLVYDAAGNLKSDGRWDYTWDALDRLTKVESKTTAPAESKRQFVYTYDAGGRRIQKDDYTWNSSTLSYQLSTTTKFLYDGWDLVAELDGATGAPIRTYGWLGKSGGLLWVKDHELGQTHVPSFDGNQNVTRLINYADRSTSAEYEYEPFGGVWRATGPMALRNPFRFSSEYHDDVTGLVYYGYRYYSPHTRRWLSRDPIGLAGGPNLYAFVGNNPINERDLFGLGEAKCPYPGYQWWNQKTWMLPKGGTWQGAVGNSAWTPPAGSSFNQLTKGLPIDYVYGVPDFKPHLQPLEIKGIKLPTSLPIEGLTGDHRVDTRLTIEELSRRTGIPVDEIQDALTENKAVIHHYHDGEMQISPKGLNDVKHSGPASGYRAGNCTLGEGIGKGIGRLMKFGAIAALVSDPGGALAGGTSTMGDGTLSGALDNAQATLMNPVGVEVDRLQAAFDTLESLGGSPGVTVGASDPRNMSLYVNYELQALYQHPSFFGSSQNNVDITY